MPWVYGALKHWNTWQGTKSLDKKAVDVCHYAASLIIFNMQIKSAELYVCEIKVQHLCIINDCVVSAREIETNYGIMWCSCAFLLVLIIKSISRVSRHLFVVVVVPELIHHARVTQQKAFRDQNYQIVALTALWAFLAYDVTQNLILKHLNAKRYTLPTDKIHHSRHWVALHLHSRTERLLLYFHI